MSSKIDERVVAMKFNGDQFSKGIADTSGALDKLKNALKLDGAVKGLTDLSAAGRNVSLAGIASGVEDVASRFSGLQAIGVGALIAIGGKAVEIGQTMITSLGSNLTSAMRDGFSDYNTKLTSVKTIMNATGSDIETVNGYFKQLDTYADKTVYNLTDMTGAFAKFTNAGVGMDQSVPAIMGIANMVALAGQGAGEASIAMYNLSQSIAGGFLTTTDYKSLNLANVATKEWKNEMINAAVAAGTLSANADGTYNILADGSGKATTAAALFNEELSTGWASADILLGVLGKYGDETTELGIKAYAAAQNVKSLPMMMETLAAAAGTGWTDTFEILLGNVDEATELWSYLTGEIGGFTEASAEARNSQLQLWSDLGGRTALFDALKNIFAALHSVMGPIGEAWAEVFPPQLGNTLAQISFWIRDFTAGLILSEDAQGNLKMVATGLFSVLKFGIDIIMGIGKVIFGIIGFVLDLAGAIISLIGPVLTFVRSLMPVSDSAEEATSGVEKFFNMLNGAREWLTGWLPEAIRNLSGGFDNFLNGGELKARVETVMGALKNLGDVVTMVWDIFTKGDFNSNAFFQEDSGFVDVLFNIREAFIAVVGAFQDFGKSVAEAGGRAKNFWEGVGNVIKAVWEYIKPLADKIGEIFGDITEGLDLDTILAGVNAGVLVGLGVGIAKIIKSFAGAFEEVGSIKKSFVDALDQLGGALGRFGQETKADQLIKIAAALIILAGALWILSTIDPERLLSSVIAMATSFGILLGGLAILDKIEAEPSIKASVAITLIAFAINILATAIVKMGELDPMQLAQGLVAMMIALFAMIVAMETLSMLGDDIWKGAAALVIMAVALNMLIIPITALGLLPIDILVQGMVALGIVLFGLVIAAQQMSAMGPKMALAALGLIAMAIALNLLVIPITALGLLPMEVLLQGMITLGILLAGLVIAAQMLAPLGPQMALASLGLVAMAIAINLLMGPIMLLGAMDIGMLIQGLIGLALVMGVLVVAAMAMTGAVAGTVGMIAMAAAVLILSLALAMLSGIGIEGLLVGIIGLAVALGILGLAALVLTPTIPMMFAMAGAFAVLALGAILLAAALLIGAIAVGMMGPALMSLTAGLETFAAAGDTIVAAVGPMLALGAGLLVFGAGALVAGAGALVLGAGLILLGAGLAIVAAVGILGAVALGKVVEKITGLMVHIPGMLAMGGAFVVLGGGVGILGIGLIALSAGAMMAALALMMLMPLGPLVTMSINQIGKALEKFGTAASETATISADLTKLGKAVTTLAENGKTAANGMNALSGSFLLLSAGAMMAGAAVTAMSATTPPSVARMIAALASGPPAFMAFATAIMGSMTIMNAGLMAGSNVAVATVSRLGAMVGALLSASIRASYGGVYASSVELGGQMTAGMSRGLQNGSPAVSAMARQVARTALTAAKRELGVASPSKEFTWLGEMNDAGLVKGMKNGLGAVDSAGTRVGNVAIKAVQRSLSELKNSVAIDPSMVPTIRPVLDLSNVRKGVGEMDGMLSSPRTLQVSDSYAMASSLAAQQRANAESASDSSGSGDEPRSGDTYVQNIYSPKALSNAEIYRNTKNFISTRKGEDPTNANQR